MITLTSVVYCVFFLVRRQINEVTQPIDAYTPIRRYILCLLLVILLTLLPAVTYQFLVAIGHEYRAFRNVVSIISGITIVALFVCLHLIFTFKVKKGKK